MKIDLFFNIGYLWSFLGFIQNNGWYFLAFIILLTYLVPKLWPHYLKWLERRAVAAYDANIKKSMNSYHTQFSLKETNKNTLNYVQFTDPDLFKQKQEELQRARVKFQEEYEKKAKIALEKQKEVKLN